MNMPWIITAAFIVVASVMAVTMLESYANRVTQEARSCGDFDSIMGPLLDNAGMTYPEGHACAKYID